MITSDSMRGFNDLLILAILSKGDNYGYEISQAISALSKGKHILKETTLYSALARMEKNHWLLSYEGDQTFGRKRTYYSISPQGREEFSRRIEEWGEIQEVINNILTEVNDGKY